MQNPVHTHTGFCASAIVLLCYFEEISTARPKVRLQQNSQIELGNGSCAKLSFCLLGMYNFPLCKFVERPTGLKPLQWAHLLWLRNRSPSQIVMVVAMVDNCPGTSPLPKKGIVLEN